MAKEIIINTTSEKHRIVLLKHSKVREYHEELHNNPYAVGNIYLGRVENFFANLNAAFVDIGDKRHAFLNYLDLAPHFADQQSFLAKALGNTPKPPKLENITLGSTLNRKGNITQVLKRGDKVLVQVNTEAVSSKAIRLYGNLSITGRNLILIPFSNEISISRKIASAEERIRLQRLITSMVPPNFGVVVRTVAKGKEAALLDKDLKDLLKTWREGIKRLRNAKPGKKVITELNRTSSILRDVLNEGFDQVIVDDPKTYEEIKQYIQRTIPEKEKIVKLYKGKTDILEHFSVEPQLRNYFGKFVPLEGGGYLIVEKTEAMHVIDVNSGKYSTKHTDQESAALHINLVAAKAIAEVIAMREMAGMIAIDFISMSQPQNKQKLYETMKQHMQEDRAKATVFKLNKVGVMHITRERRRPMPQINTEEHCPTCHGSGKIEDSLGVVKHIEGQLSMLFKQDKIASLTLYVHPYLHAYLTKGLLSQKARWAWHYWRSVTIQEDSKLAINDFKLTDAQDRLLAEAPRLHRSNR